MFFFKKQNDYLEHGDTYKFLKKVMALPFLPAEPIQSAFESLKASVSTPKLTQFMTYVEETWIVNHTFVPEKWTVYKMSVRTNNDVEGWHHRLNRYSNVLILKYS